MLLLEYYILTLTLIGFPYKIFENQQPRNNSSLHSDFNSTENQFDDFSTHLGASSTMKYSIPDKYFFTQCVSLRCLSTSWTAYCRITPKKCNLEKTVNFTVFLCFSLFLCSEVANLLSNLMICIFSWIGTYFCHVPYTCCSKYGRFCLFCVILKVNVNVDWNNSVEKTCCFFCSPPPSPPSSPPSPLPFK